MIIRINLHPAKKIKKKSDPSGAIFAFFLLIAVAALGVFYFMAADKDEEADGYRAKSAEIQQDIDRIKAHIQDLSKIRSNVTELEKRQQILGKLASTRQGPQYVLNEISRLLSNPKDGVTRKEANELGWTVAWEPENIILKSFKDIGNGRISMDGTARQMDDIQEFWTRMKTSSLLRNVRLVEIKDSRDAVINETVQSFLFEAEVNFNYRTREGQKIVDSLTKEVEDSPEQPAAKPAAAN